MCGELLKWKAKNVGGSGEGRQDECAVIGSSFPLDSFILRKLLRKERDLQETEEDRSFRLSRPGSLPNQMKTFQKLNFQ